jgi:hypothetical protein
MVAAIYLRNTVRLAGLLALTMGLVLLTYQGWIALHGDLPPEFYLGGPVRVVHWLSHASPLIQGLLGWPWLVLEEVPLPLLLLVGGALAIHV